MNNQKVFIGNELATFFHPVRSRQSACENLNYFFFGGVFLGGFLVVFFLLVCFGFFFQQEPYQLQNNHDFRSYI